MKRQTRQSAGYDIAVTTGGWVLPFMTKKFETQASFNIEDDEAVLLLPRSSVGIKRKLRLSNSVALIDADFWPNECMISLHNFGWKPQYIEAGERVAQALVIKYQTLKGEEEPTQERNGGIGSTGKSVE